MAKVPTPKAVEKSVLGGVKQGTSAKGPFGGGTKFNQMKPGASFALPTVKGHSQKVNVTPVVKGK